MRIFTFGFILFSDFSRERRWSEEAIQAIRMHLFQDINLGRDFVQGVVVHRLSTHT